jgi:type I restriction enzyme S subunit
MKQGWTYKKLGEVATFINGYPFKPTDWKNSGRKIIRIQNLNNPNATYNFYDGSIDPKYLVSNGDVLISWSGSLGVFEWSEDEAILNQHIFKVVFNKGHINKKFFEYVVASRINEMKS